MEKGLSKTQIVSELTKSPHGKLLDYTNVGRQAATEDPNFFAHLVAWNATHGSVRDSKIALPVLALRDSIPELQENALAHMGGLDPRSFVKSLDFAREVHAPSKLLSRLVNRYLREKEVSYGNWERTAIQHRGSMKTLYARYHVKPPAFADASLFKGTGVGRFGVVAGLSMMTPVEAANAIVEWKIPFLVAQGALGKTAKDPLVVMTLIERMSQAELVTNTKALERLGVLTNPILRAAFESALVKASKTAPRTTMLKATRAASVLGTELAAKVQTMQEKQLDVAGGIEGDWLVLGDKSGSMSESIELSKQVAALLSRMVKGSVHLIFFDTYSQSFEVKGKTLEQIQRETRSIMAGGGTSIGCGLQTLLDNKTVVNGIVIVSDGGENTSPFFASVYKKYTEKLDVEPTVYFLQTRGEPDRLSGSLANTGIDVQRFDLTGGADHYSLPSIIPMLRVGRSVLVEEIMATPLLILDQVLPHTQEIGVLTHV